MTREAVDAARRALGPVGVLLPVSFAVSTPIALQRDAVVQLEHAGYRAAWTNEVVGGKDAFVQLAILLAATERMVFGTSVANIWARAAPTAHAAAAQLAEAFPGRFVLGLGVGNPQQAASVGREIGRPRATLRHYLEEMDTPTAPPAPGTPYVRLLGANGRKMAALGAEVADGVIPAMVSSAFTAELRAIVGADKLVVVLTQAVDDAATTAAIVQEQLAAGADHVVVSVSRDGDFRSGVERQVELASALPPVR